MHRWRRRVACQTQAPSHCPHRSNATRLLTPRLRTKYSDRQQRLQLQTLPPNRVVQKVKDGKVIFVYADPYACGCLYIGDEAAWDNYKREQLQQNFIDQQRMTAEMNENAAWNWSMWGPGWWAY